MMYLANPPRITAQDSLVLVVDIQEKLLPHIPTGAMIVRNSEFLLDVAKRLDVPIQATEQYPKGLGPTTASIAQRLDGELPTKTAFSCCGAAVVFEELHRSRRPNIILVGMETHVCILQTALDLLAQGFRPWLAVDALGSRASLDHEIALQRLEKAGAIRTTVETVAFEWLTDASHPQFKPVSQLVQNRMKGIA